MSNKHPPQQTMTSSETGAPEATILRGTSKATTPPLRGTPPYQEGSRKNSPPEKGEYPEGGRGLIPKLRFPEFREAPEWERKRLGDLCKIQTGRKDANEGAQDGEYPFFTCAEKHIFSKTYSFDAEAILVAGNANVGQTNYYNGKFEAYQRTYVLTDFSEVDVAYLYLLLSADLRRALLSQVQSSAMSYIKLPMLKEYELPVPSTQKEQKKIADCLSSLDTLITAQAEKIDALKTHKKGLMQQLFPQDGETVPRLRFSEFRDAGEWELKPFDKFVVKSFYGTSSSTSESGQYPVLRMGNMSEGRINFSNLVYIDLDPEAFEKIKLVRGDILLNRTNSLDLVGKISLFDQDFECITASYIVTYRLDGEQIDSLFCNFMLNTQLNQAKIKALARPSVSQANINPTAFRNELSVAVPEITEQQKIADCLSSLDTLITAETEKLDALKTHKKGLMQQLFPAVENEIGS